MIRAFLQINCRFQVYTTQDATGMIRAFLQVNVDFRYTLPRQEPIPLTQDTTGMSRAFLQVNFLKLINYSYGYKQIGEPHFGQLDVS